LGWLLENEESFRVAPKNEDELLAQVKHLVELMMLLNTLSSHDLRGDSISKLTQQALKYGAEFDWHQLAAYDASAATVVAIVAEFFDARNLAPPLDLDYIRSLHSIGFFEGMDRIPFREMDLSYCLSLIISPDFSKQLPAEFMNTAFGLRQHLARYMVDDLYSLTHAVFYLTNFGRSQLSGILDHETVIRLKRELVALTAAMLRADNIDVLGELLLCWLFCAIVDTPLHRVVFRESMDRMLSATRPDGQVLPVLKMMPRAQAGETAFEDVYHTTLVGGMLFSLAAQEMPYVH
jgi:hypothetical protein